MKKAYFYLLLGSLLLIIISLLFWQENWQRQEAGEKYTVVAFSNTENTFNARDLSDKNVFDFFIENSFREAQNYKIYFFINQEKIGEKEVKINPRSQKNINLSPETIKKITQSLESSLKYKVKIYHNDKKSSIAKKINLIK
jgi:uncharacterized protein YkuJ